jgi:hypothetical protein
LSSIGLLATASSASLPLRPNTFESAYKSFKSCLICSWNLCISSSNYSTKSFGFGGGTTTGTSKSLTTSIFLEGLFYLSLETLTILDGFGSSRSSIYIAGKGAYTKSSYESWTLWVLACIKISVSSSEPADANPYFFFLLHRSGRYRRLFDAAKLTLEVMSYRELLSSIRLYLTEKVFGSAKLTALSFPYDDLSTSAFVNSSTLMTPHGLFYASWLIWLSREFLLDHRLLFFFGFMRTTLGRLRFESNGLTPALWGWLTSTVSLPAGLTFIFSKLLCTSFA